MSGGVRLSEVLTSLSLATDLGFGQPTEHMLRAARIAMRIGDRLALERDALAAVYDVSVLTYVGCPVYGNESALLFGDDIEFRAQALRVDLAGMPARRLMMRQAGHGTSMGNRMRQRATLMATNGSGVIEQMANHCAAAGILAERLGLSDDVRRGLEQSYARWDGKGVPAGLAGESLSLAARIAHVAEACEVFQRTDGPSAAVAMVQARRGTHFDPSVADVVLADAGTLFDGLDQHTLEEVLDAEPVERPMLTDTELDRVLEAIGDFCDLRCPYFTGHASGTAALAADAAAVLHLTDEDVSLLRRAAFVHDIGRFGVPGSVWDKPGPLSTAEQEKVRLHAYYVERIFARPEPLHRIGLLAGTHHERMDGSGYHRAVGGTMLATPARILAAADAYHAMTQPRPHRPALEADDAATELRRDADRGRLDPTAVDAVLAAAGHPSGRARAGGPVGLTAREADVLGLLAQGLQNKQIAGHLGISPKTVGNHIEHIYAKLGVTNRAGAAMRAMEHGLVGPVGATDSRTT